MASPQFIQRAYIAFFNRPADKAGFDFWLGYGGPDQDLLNQFADSAEYKSDFDGKSSREIIGIVYQNLFGRPPEAEGWNYWEAQMNAGWVTVGNAAYEILGGAQGADLATVNNKTTAAQNFTSALSTTANANAYAKAGDNGVGHLAKEWLATVSHDNLANAQNNLNGLLNALVNANIPSPHHDDEDNLLIVDSSLYDYTVTFTHPNGLSSVFDYNTIKWNGNFGTGTVTVFGFDKFDRLDFTAYGARAVGVANLRPTSYEHEYRADTWAAYSFHSSRYLQLSAGDKYITVTREHGSTTTVHKIELWMVNGYIADGYWNGGILPAGEELDTAQLIGYVDLGFELYGKSFLPFIDF